MFRKYVRNIVLNLLTNMCSRYIINSAKHMFADNCFEEMMEGYRMSTRRIYLEGLKETDENADKKDLWETIIPVITE